MWCLPDDLLPAIESGLDVHGRVQYSAWHRGPISCRKPGTSTLNLGALSPRNAVCLVTWAILPLPRVDGPVFSVVAPACFHDVEPGSCYVRHVLSR